MTARVALLALVFAAGNAAAQVRPQPAGGDPRLQTVAYQRDQVVQISAAPGYQVTIELAPDEQIETIAVGDSAAWQVTANRGGNLLFVKALQAGADTNMTVVTNARFYAFDLTGAGAGGLAPYEVQFSYPPPEGAAETRLPGEQSEAYYEIKGAVALRPLRMSDDDHKTYIEWPISASLPAVFVIDDRGREALASGQMRGDYYVIDDIHDRLIFRIDKQIARAYRRFERKPGK